MWELNACTREHNEMQSESTREKRLQAWQIANFCGAAFAGKLKAYSFYDRKQAEKQPSKPININEFEKNLAAAERAQKDVTKKS